jgi:23S rRNA pseudouridine2605 synthase
MFYCRHILDKSGKSAQLCYVYGYEKEYRVLMAKRPDREQVEAWKRGVILEDGYKTQPVEVRFEASQGKGAWVRVIMGEGRKRQIREICQQLGLPVVRIVRVRIGTLRLGNLKPRQWRHLYSDEVDALKGKETKRREVKRFDVKKTHRG